MNLYSYSKKALMFLVLAVSFPAISQQGSPAENYLMFCGTRQGLVQFLNSQGQNGNGLSESDFAELNSSRVPVLRILKGGAKAIQEILDEGSKSDIGGFGALLACSVITQTQSEIKQKGCVDLVTQKGVRDTGGGISACDVLMKKVQKKSEAKTAGCAQLAGTYSCNNGKKMNVAVQGQQFEIKGLVNGTLNAVTDGKDYTFQGATLNSVCQNNALKIHMSHERGEFDFSLVKNGAVLSVLSMGQTITCK